MERREKKINTQCAEERSLEHETDISQNPPPAFIYLIKHALRETINARYSPDSKHQLKERTDVIGPHP
ncbi:hypothetical protein DPEC_G00270630 [Dallia pectoralis]|uniref:Uncharacterized protein n=1 Tax=Dallia pectoralis TaxID=75939 RepID=A0ACC2FPA6_DALPE|nr:hypothetical protein DPEC_G00270630 [Dallia pectoralis]